MQRFVIDRFEGSFAVCEDEAKAMRNIPRSELPENVREGDCLVCENGEWFIDQNETQGRKARISSLMDALFKD